MINIGAVLHMLASHKPGNDWDALTREPRKCPLPECAGINSLDNSYRCPKWLSGECRLQEDSDA